MDLRYPSSLQKRYANTVFPDLPNELIVEILTKMDEESYENLCKSTEFRAYCSSNSIFSERIYEERVKRFILKRFNGNLIQFKPRDMKWREFHDRIIYFIDHLGTLQLNELAEDNKLMELKIYYNFFNILPNTIGANRAAYNNHYEVLEWLSEKGVLPDDNETAWAANDGRLDMLKWLYGKGVRPTKRAAELATIHNRKEVVEWLATKGIYSD
ncbi:MAG: hypothetical protein Solivirus1_82 [Solivirus sp.]|uniref:F-box domain-containing protein n=1 Tax=Solivirus sp. TaxID=2487772 RepID=A0A3G5AFC8_9VIRU|nr:MAG: hypothetical protein Solivirus1_82 [Solivirus sp.]